MSDLVFLLLVFFILTSTLVSPNVIPLLLPNSNTPSPIESQNVTLYINEQLQYFIEDESHQVTEEQLESELNRLLSGLPKGNVVLRADKTVDIQNVVGVMDAVNNINKATGKNYKVILATQPK